MLARLRSKLTYPHVVSTLALFVALGGTAYAAATIGSDDVIDDSLRSEDIKNETLRGGDLTPGTIGSSRVADGTLVSSDVQDDALTGTDIKNGTIGASDVAANSRGGGRIADNSLKGTDIDEGSLTGVKISGITYVYGDSRVNGEATSQSFQGANAYCPPGQTLIGTGFDVTGGKAGVYPDETSAITVNVVDPGEIYVKVEAYETLPIDANWYVTAIGICANAEQSLG
jgi:hypothetical protein